ncbi:P63C domain-containing protein [Idiomarina sp.]|uniref:P63C domain-containing protein n=1 Tax=Idiomarina sp. TaxID=1874361 RepID=UPI003A955820
MDRAKYTGVLNIAGNEISCAVLDNETRVVNGTNVLKAFGRKQMGTGKHSGLSPILTSKKLEEFVAPDEIRALQPITYLAKNGREQSGYPAEVIQIICEIYLRARDDNSLEKGQLHLAEQAEIIVRSLAKTAIVALIDEATGYQYEREKDALQKILSAYIREDYMVWQQTFPRKFYKELFRLCDWEYNPSNVKRPAYLGKLTNKYVYELLPQGVLEKLRELNPTTETGGRRRKHHQHLTDDARTHLERHLTKIITLMEISDDFNQLDHSVNRVFRDVDQLSLELINR